MTQRSTQDYIETMNPQGYVNNREITNLSGHWLVKGSRDCVIVNKEKVSSRLGFELVGAAKTKNKGHHSSYDWETSFNRVRSLRMNDDGELEVLYRGSWYEIKQYTALTRANFTPWFSDTEGQDLLLFVVQTDGIQMWSGGIVKIATATATTVTIQGYMAGATFAFVEGGAGVDDTITDSGNGFVTAGFEVGDVITIAGSASNDGTYTIKAVTAGTITLSSNDDLTAEAAGASVTITRPRATWAEQGFLTAGTRKIVISGTEYAYTGGESTPTLTGLSGLPAIAAGTVTLQAVRESTPATLDGLTLDLVAVTNNYVVYGDLTHRTIYVSASSDYTSFSFTTPLRVPGEGFTVDLDSTPTAFIPGAVEDEFYIDGRKDDRFKMTFELSADQGDEQIRIKKLPTATGQAARSQGCVFRIKNGVSILTFEPTIDDIVRTLSINTPTSRPISDDIRDDLLTYDLDDAHGLFNQNQLFIALPQEGVMIIYDYEQGHWQPPHFIPVGRLALIDINDTGVQELCGHSSVSNETYKLYTGYNDNGAGKRIEVHMEYNNYGSRFSLKTTSEYATEVYMSENTKVTNRVVLDYKGATGVLEFEMDGATEANRFRPRAGGGFGFDKLGNNPLGSLATQTDDLSKYRFIDVTTPKDSFELQRVFIAEGLDIRFSLVARGEDAELSENIPTYIKR